MDKIKLLNGDLISVVEFDARTNKVYPYYQNSGSRYARCPYCHSVVNIKGGRENKNQSTHKKMFATHHTKKIDRFELNNYQECPFYQGNKNNWQRLYQINNNITENRELKNHIDNNQVIIAEELSQLTGIAFSNLNLVNTLFDKLYKSFIKNGGLCRKQWHPEMISRIILINAGPVMFWGYKIISDEVALIIKKNNDTKDAITDNNQFVKDNVFFVATLDNNDNPNNIHLKLLWNNGKELVLKDIVAGIY